MPANSDPIFTKNVKTSSVLVTAANTSSQGGGTVATDIFLLGTADATNGSYIRKVRMIPTASVAATTTTATVARIFISTVSSGATTSANTRLIAEVSLAAIPAAHSTTAVFWQDLAVNEPIGAGESILVTNHAAPAASTAWRFVMFYGDY